MEQLSNKLDNTPTLRGLRAASERLDCKPEELIVTSVSGGYSRNRRALVGFDNSWIFVKEVDTDLLSDDGIEELDWLRKDYACVIALQNKVP